ncbi:MAG: RhtB family transporter, partial [uncultured Nocardioides sp.]
GGHVVGLPDHRARHRRDTGHRRGVHHRGRSGARSSGSRARCCGMHARHGAPPGGGPDGPGGRAARERGRLRDHQVPRCRLSALDGLEHVAPPSRAARRHRRGHRLVVERDRIGNHPQPAQPQAHLVLLRFPAPVRPCVQARRDRADASPQCRLHGADLRRLRRLRRVRRAAARSRSRPAAAGRANPGTLRRGVRRARAEAGVRDPL